MTNIITVISIILLFMLGVVIVRFETPGAALRHLRANRGPLKGILIFMGGFTALAIAAFLIGGHARASEWRYFQFAEAYAGVEWPMVGISPQCVADGPDDKTTSNGGARLNLVEYRRFLTVNAKYTHHSCAFNDDRNTYDAWGVELTVPIFDRRK